MLNEAGEQTLKQRLNEVLYEDEYDEIIKAKVLNIQHFRSISIDQGAFETCLVQLVALNLITKSVRGRSVKDKQTYWKLTEDGEKLMYQLRAVRRN